MYLTFLVFNQKYISGHSSIHSPFNSNYFCKHLSSFSCVPDTALGFKNRAGNDTTLSFPPGA